MNQLQIEHLRDFAIEYLPRAQTDRQQARQYGLTEADFQRRLAFSAVMVGGQGGATAVERAAASVLVTVSLLCSEREQPLSRAEVSGQVEILISQARELCTLTGKTILWLDSVPTLPTPAQEDEPPAPATQKLPQPIAGRILSTREAAQALGVKESTLRTWACQQKGALLPCGKVGRQNRYSGDEILEIVMSKQSSHKKKK
jgi:hypothetical protein